jgi:hypothetical protein
MPPPQMSARKNASPAAAAASLASAKMISTGEEQQPPPPAAADDHPEQEQQHEDDDEEGYEYEEEEEEEDVHTPVGVGAGGIISPAAAGHGDPALANVLEAVCDVCEQRECACDLVATRRGIIFEGSPPETKRGGKPHLPKQKHAITPTTWRPANKIDYRGHHRPPHRDPHHALVGSRDADFGGGVAGGGKKWSEEAAADEEAAAAPSVPLSAIDAEVQPPVVPPPGLKGRPSHTGGERIPQLELQHTGGAGGSGHVAGHKHRGQAYHQEFKSLG